jgi:signal peptidase I
MWRVGLLVTYGVLAIAGGCFGSDGGDETEYEDRVFELLAQPGEGREDLTRSEAAELAEEFADQLDSLSPPDSIEDEHDEVVDGFREIARIARRLEEDDLDSPSSDDVEAALAYRDATDAWLDAFAEEYGVRHFKSEGLSMGPTIGNGEHFKVPDYDGGEIERGQIIVLEFHLGVEDEPKRYFLKRVIGLPGESVEVRDGTVFVDGVALDEDYTLQPPTYTYGPKMVPEGSYFVLGDNRRNSYDSHQWGAGCAPEQACDFVPEENVIGVLPADAEPYATTPD